MSLRPKQARELIESIRAARDEPGMGCQECLDELAAFVEFRLTGETLSSIHRKLEAHLSECTDCREEYEALRQAIEALEERE